MYGTVAAILSVALGRLIPCITSLCWCKLSRREQRSSHPATSHAYIFFSSLPRWTFWWRMRWYLLVKLRLHILQVCGRWLVWVFWCLASFSLLTRILPQKHWWGPSPDEVGGKTCQCVDDEHTIKTLLFINKTNGLSKKWQLKKNKIVLKYWIHQIQNRNLQVANLTNTN